MVYKFKNAHMHRIVGVNNICAPKIQNNFGAVKKKKIIYISLRRL